MIELSKQKLGFYRQLLQKKHRLEHRLCLVYGEKLLYELVHSAFKIESIIIRSDYSGFLPEDVNVPIYFARTTEFNKLTDQPNPEGVLAIAKIPQWRCFDNLDITQPTVLLWEVQDPGNLGTLIRTMHWFGIQQILLTPNCAEITAPKTLRAAMGAFFYIKPFWLPDNPIHWISQQADNIYAASMQGASIKNIQPKKKILLLGSESHGIPKEVIENQSITKISVPGNSGESLNVAVAGGILMYWFTLGSS